MSGGSTSDGPKKGSGKDTGPKVVALPKKPAEEVGGYADGGSNNPLLNKIARMDEYHEREKRRWLDQNNLLSDKLRDIRDKGMAKIEMLREINTDLNEELNNARAKVDKYLERNLELEDRIEELEKQIAEYKDVQ